jgi:zinc protease
MSKHFRTIKSASISMFALALTLPLSQGAWAQAAVDAKPDTAQTAPATPASPATQAATVTPWGHTSPDIESDPNVRYGVLANGMKYAVQRNETPKSGAAIRMHINVGSIAEAENERGLAHLLEHMAFNGSKNVPEGQMTKTLERLGLAFGADTNASTGFDATIYQLDLPKTDDETVDTSLMLMRETASNLTIAPAAVERERGVVLSEMQTRNSTGLRRVEHLLKAALPDTPFGNRFPIGTAEVLKTAPAERIKNFYTRYYRPENATIVVVGDFDVDAMEAKIKSKFADWKGVGPAGTPMNRGTVKPAAIPAFSNFSDPAATVEVEYAVFRPFVSKVPSKETSKVRTIESIASGIMNKRFQKLSLAENAPIRGGSISLDSILNAADQTGISINGKEGDWKGALAVGEQELRRAMQFGFTQAELDEQIANYDTAYKDGLDQANTRRSADLANAIVGTIENKFIVTTPKFDFALWNEQKKSFTLDSVNAAFKTAFSATPSIIHITTKEPIAKPQDEILAVIMESNKVAVAAPDQTAVKAFAYSNFGKPGKIASDKMITDMGIRTIRFSNNVRLNIKKTDFEKGVVRFGLRVGDGGLAIINYNGPLQYFISGMNAVAGLKEHSFSELQTIMAGKSVSFGLSMSSDTFGTSGSTTPTDAALQMNILAAYLSAPGYRTEANSVWKNGVDSFAAQIDAMPQTVAALAVPRILASGDRRFGLGSISEVSGLTVEDMKAAVSEQFAKAPIEIAIVGDIEEQAAIDMVAKSFGALPMREIQSRVGIKERLVFFPKSRAPITLYHKGKVDQGMVQAYWPTTDNKDQKADAIRNMTADVFGLLLLDEVREKLGATYSPSTFSYSANEYTDYGYFGVSVVAEPAKMQVVSDAIKSITKQMRDGPVDADVLLRARKPLLEQIEKAERENGSWLRWASKAQSKPEELDRKRKSVGILTAITAQDIQAAAQKYLTDDAELEIRIINETLKAAATPK